MSLVKARIQGNATVVTIPKSFNVKPGTEFRFKKGENGTLILSPSKKSLTQWKSFLKIGMENIKRQTI